MRRPTRPSKHPSCTLHRTFPPVCTSAAPAHSVSCMHNTQPAYNRIAFLHVSRHTSAAVPPATSHEHVQLKTPPSLTTSTSTATPQHRHHRPSPAQPPPHHRGHTTVLRSVVRPPNYCSLHANRRLVTSFSKPFAGCSARLETFRSAAALHQGILDTKLQRPSGIKPGKLLHPTATCTLPLCPPNHSILPSRPARSLILVLCWRRLFFPRPTAR
jgi:hypothetical protein